MLSTVIAEILATANVTDTSIALCTDIRSTSSLEILSNRTIQVPAADATVTEKVIHTSGSFNSTMTIVLN